MDAKYGLLICHFIVRRSITHAVPCSREADYEGGKWGSCLQRDSVHQGS